MLVDSYQSKGANMSVSYVKQIRNKTHYPAFRGVATVGLRFTYLCSVVIAIIGLISQNIPTMIGGVIAGIFLGFVAKSAYEASLMLADIADSTIEQAARPKLERYPQADIAQNGGDFVNDHLNNATSSSSSAEDWSKQLRGTRPLVAEADCEEVLQSAGYRLTPSGSGWVVKEPLGGKMKVHTLEELIEYSTSKRVRS